MTSLTHNETSEDRLVRKLTRVDIDDITFNRQLDELTDAEIDDVLLAQGWTRQEFLDTMASLKGSMRSPLTILSIYD